MVEAQGAGDVVKVLLEQGNGLLEPARIPVGAGKGAARAERVGVVGTREAGDVGEVLLIQGDGLVASARIPVGAGERAARGQGFRMVEA